MPATVAMNVCGVVMTSSPGPTPAAWYDSVRASVQLLTPIACFTPQNSASRASKLSVCWRRIRSPASRVDSTMPMISDFIEAKWAG